MMHGPVNVKLVYTKCVEPHPNVHYHIHKCLLLVPLLSHMKLVHTSHPVSLRYILVCKVLLYVCLS